MGNYIEQSDKESGNEDNLDIYQLMVMGLKIGISYSEFYNLDVVTLVNLLTVAYKPHKRKPTQAEIDLIT